MKFNPRLLVKDFFDRNIFERIILYLIFAEVIVQIFFVVILGGWDFIQGQNRQWIFYGLLALDYIICHKRVINIKFTLNPISIFALSLFVMVAHGIFAGIINNNSPFIILNDTVPIMMIALNILRMQSFSEVSKPIDISFLLRVVVVTSCIMIGAGLIVGNPNIGNATIIFPLFIVCLFYLKPPPIISILILSLLIVLVIDELNRTSMAFLLFSSCFIIMTRMVKQPILGVISFFSLIAILSVGAVIVPEDSQTYRRVAGLTQIDLTKRTGSIGERQAEQDAVNAQLADKSTVQQFFGLGFGNTYSVKLSHKYNTGYNHAHFAWIWFKMRYGSMGYFYLCLLMGALIYSGIYNLRHKEPEYKFVGLMCVLCLIYCFSPIKP